MLMDLDGGPTASSKREHEAWRTAQQRPSRLFDYTLRAGDTVVRTSRVTLMAWSDYFETLFGSDLMDTDAEEYAFEEVDGPCLLAVVEAMYARQVELTRDNFNGILEVADLLRVSSVVAACKQFLDDMIAADGKFNEGFALANACQVSHLRDELVKKFIDSLPDHFAELSTEDEDQLTDEQLLQLLTSDELNVPTEMIAWHHVQQLAPQRPKIADKLWQSVRMEYLEPAEVLDIVASHGPLSAEAAKELAIRAGAVIARPPRAIRVRRNTGPTTHIWRLQLGLNVVELESIIQSPFFCMPANAGRWRMQLLMNDDGGLDLQISMQPLPDGYDFLLVKETLVSFNNPRTGFLREHPLGEDKFSSGSTMQLDMVLSPEELDELCNDENDEVFITMRCEHASLGQRGKESMDCVA